MLTLFWTPEPVSNSKIRHSIEYQHITRIKYVNYSYVSELFGFYYALAAYGRKARQKSVFHIERSFAQLVHKCQ